MLISEEELKRRLNSPRNLVNSLRKEEAPKTLQVVAGTLAHIEDKKEVAREFGMSESQINKAKNLPEVKSTVNRVQELALDMLLDSLGLLSKDLLIGEKPKDISIIAANLSRVYSNISPKNVQESRTQVLIYTPQQRSVKDYDIIDVKL